MLLLVYCCMYLPLFMGFCVGLCFGVHYLSSCAIISTRKRGLGDLLLLSFVCRVTANPHGVVGWSVVFDCGIS